MLGALTVLAAFVLLGLSFGRSSAEPADANTRAAIVLELKGAVGPATASYIERGLKSAAESGAPVVVLQIDTPGGLDSSMREIVYAILASSVPVLGFVAPSGSRAASAGTYILYACHIAAMAPATNLGAATPIKLSGGMLPSFGDDSGKDKRAEPRKDGDKPLADGGAAAPEPRSAEERKAVNDAVAYIRALADLRGRNAQWAERAVRQAASLPAKAALSQKVIDLLAIDVYDLLQKVEGRTLLLGNGEITLHTAKLGVEFLPPDWRNRFLATITDPNIALVFMMIGVYGLLFEFMNPGSVLPGTVGGICLLVGLYALNMLPVNYAGFALVLLGMGLMVAEHFAPAFGVLGIGGIAAFVLGAGVLIDTKAPGFEIAWPVIGAVAGTSLFIMLFVVPMGIEAQRRAVVSGREAMLGARGRVEEWNGEIGYVFVRGERWRATCGHPLSIGQIVQVSALEGLTVTVVPIESEQT